MRLNDCNDLQNHLLTQLSYQSDILQDNYNGKSFYAIYRELLSIYGPDNDATKIFEQMCNAGLGDLIIKDVANNSTSGFGAISFEDSEGRVGITYRGTDGITSVNDMLDNAGSFATGTSYQSAEAEAFYEKNRDPDGENYLYGHSKGGELSQSVYINHYDEINELHNINPQPVNPYSLTPDQTVALNSDKVDIVVTEGDYVWFLGGIPYSSRIRVMDNPEGNDPHLFYLNRYDENGNIIPGSQPFWEYLVVGGLTILSFPIQFIGSGIGWVYNTTVRIVEFVKNDLIPFAQSVVDTLVDAVRKINDALHDFVDSVGTFFNDLINGVRDWWNQNFNAGYRYANENPYIVIDTTKMSNYASQLSALSTRSKNLDVKMNNLYWQLGIDWNTIANLGKLLKAGFILDYAWRLDACVNYLNQTAEDFNRNEKEISDMVG